MLQLLKRAERQAHMQRFWSVGNVAAPAERSKHLPGWPRNNTAHLEAAPLRSGPSDGWGDLSRTSS